jgi:hypothetical protein
MTEGSEGPATSTPTPNNQTPADVTGGGGADGGTAAPGAEAGKGGGKKDWRDALWQWLSTPPGESLVGSGVIVLTTILLMALTASLLVGITIMWPACEFPPETQTTQTPTPSPTPGTVNANANTNANTNANFRAGANTNSNNNNANANTTVNANANTAANANANTAPAVAATPTPPAGQTAGQPAPAGTPDINVIDPKSGSVLGNTSVTIKGKNLGPAEGLTVKFGEDEVKPTKVTEESISVRTPKHSEGVVDVSILRAHEIQDTLPMEYTYVCAAPQGSALFWMIIMSGALGGCIHSLRSLWWYAGQGNLKWKWMLMYFCLPFTGAAMAMLFSLLSVAGLIDSTAGRNTSLFIIAIAGLVGMFTQQAALKLTDIANAIFTRPGKGKDAQPQPSLPASGGGAEAGAATPSIWPSAGSAAGGQPVSITGTGLADVASVAFGGAAAPGFTFDAATASVRGVTPPRPAGKGEVDVVITNAAGKSVKTHYQYT